MMILILMILIGDEWDIFVNIYEITSLQYKKWIMRFWISSDQELLYKPLASVFSEYSMRLVNVMSTFFISNMSDSFIILSLILLWIKFNLAIMFLDIMYLRIGSLHWHVFLEWRMIRDVVCFGWNQWIDCASIRDVHIDEKSSMVR